MRRGITALVGLAMVITACASHGRYARVVKLGDTDAARRRTLTTWPTPTPTASVPPGPTIAEAFAEFLGATFAYTPEPSSPTPTAIATPRWHRVAEGETLASLARRYYGRSRESWRIVEANGLGKKKSFRPGLRVRIPDRSEWLPTPTFTATFTATFTFTATPTSVFIEFESRNNVAFGPGEKLTFAVQYMGVTGGTATLEIPETTDLDGHRVFHIHASAVSSPFFSKFFRVEDSTDSFLDARYLFSHRFEKRLNEGNFHPKPQHWVFDQVAETAIDHDGKVSKIQRGAEDILAAFYYFRTVPLSETDAVSIPVFSDGKSYDLLVKIDGRETITVPCGTFSTLVVEPQLKYQGLFLNKGKVTIWVTDDQRRVPVLVKSKIAIGSIDIVLVDAEVLEPID